MNILLPVAVAAVFLLIALRLYPPFIARVFREDDEHLAPSEHMADGRDYVKSKTSVVFGHHFATIAGAGPIVGPTLAIAFGWQPVWLWVVLGGIFYGAVHDMTAMFASVREGGKSVAEIARRTLGPGGYLLMIMILIFVLTIINALFLKLSVVALTSIYPIESLGQAADQTLLQTTMVDGVVKGRVGGIATTSVFIITLFAPLLGLLLRRRKLSTLNAFLIAGAVCVVSVVVGFHWPIVLDGTWSLPVIGEIHHWAVIMAVYVLIACAIPVWVVLQPRDFTNVQILYGGLLLMLVCAVIAGIGGRGMEAPAWSIAEGAAARNGPIWPILFITVACGAISGFHSLVASGTSSKQIPRESDCRRIGYGAMVLESFFAVLVIVAVGSIPRAEYMAVVVEGNNWILGFALGAGQLINAALPFIPLAVAAVLGILMIEGFIVTTLDSSIRLCRYMIEEFWNFAFQGKAPKFMLSPTFNAFIAVALMMLFYLNGSLTKMWNVFGAGNQLMGALALTTVSVWLFQRSRRCLFVLIPAITMLLTTLAALWSIFQAEFGKADGNLFLGGAAVVLMVLSVGVVAVGAWKFAQAIQSKVPMKMPPKSDTAPTEA